MTDKQIDEAHIEVLKQIRETNRRFMDHTDPECPHGITVSALDKAIAALERQRVPKDVTEGEWRQLAQWQGELLRRKVPTAKQAAQKMVEYLEIEHGLKSSVDYQWVYLDDDRKRINLISLAQLALAAAPEADDD